MTACMDAGMMERTSMFRVWEDTSCVYGGCALVYSDHICLHDGRHVPAPTVGMQFLMVCMYAPAPGVVGFQGMHE